MLGDELMIIWLTDAGLKNLIHTCLAVCTGAYFIGGICLVIHSDTKYLCVTYLHMVLFIYIFYIIMVIVK